MVAPCRFLTWYVTCAISAYRLNYVQRHRRGRQTTRRAAENHETCDQLTERMLAEMHADFDALPIDRPTANRARPNTSPRSSRSPSVWIDDRVDRAYVASNGDVMFSIDSDPQYAAVAPGSE